MHIRDFLNAPLERIGGRASKRLVAAAKGAAGKLRGKISRRDVIKAAVALGAAGATAKLVTRIPARHDFGPTVILYIADTCRADVIGKVINGIEVTPNLNRFAEKGLYFPNAYSSSNHTKTGVAGILVGDPAPVHGITWRANTIPVMPTLSTYFKDKGYGTLAMINNQWLEAEKARRGQEEFGFSRGFEQYKYYPTQMLRLRTDKGETRPRVYASDEKMRQSTFERLGPRRIDRGFKLPALIWVHSMRMHWPRLPDAPNQFTGTFHEKGLLARAGRDGVFASDWAFVNSFWQRKDNPDPRRFEALGDDEVQLIRAMYYEAASLMDYDFGTFMDELHKHGSDAVQVIFTADHGESLGGVDKEFGHGQGLGEAVLRVPLILGGRDVAQATVSRRVPNYCIPQTVMLFSGDYIRETTGLPLDPGRIKDEAPIYASARTSAAYIGGDGIKVVRDDAGNFSFYDITKDPGETAALEVAEEKRAGVVAQVADFEALCERLRKARRIEYKLTGIGWQLKMSELTGEQLKRAGEADRKSQKVDKEKIEEMKALGYLN